MARSVPVSTRIIPLEACRGIASVIVVIHHFFLAFAPTVTGFLPEARNGESLVGSMFFFVVNGSAAVIFFFVMSGHVLTQAYFHKLDTDIIAASLIKRLPRLWGPVAVSVLISYLLFVCSAYYYEPAAQLSQSPWLIDFGHAGLPQGFHPSFMGALIQSILTFFSGRAHYNGNLWTMKLEFMGSLLAFASAVVIGHVMRFRLLPYLGIIVTLSAIFFSPYTLPFFVGIFFSAVMATKKLHLPLPAAIIMIAVGFYLLGYMIPEVHYSFLSKIIHTIPEHYADWVSVIFYSIGSLLVMAAVSLNSTIHNLLNNKIGEFIGKISFPLYLLHTLIICSASSYIFMCLTGIVDTNTRLVLTFIFTLITSIVLSIPLARFDSIWVKYINRLTRRIVAQASESITLKKSVEKPISK